MSLDVVVDAEIVTNDDEYVRLDKKIDAADADAAEAFRTAMLARWEFGKRLLAEREANGGKQLPDGRLEGLCALLKRGKDEIQRRMRFAARYNSIEEVQHACCTYGSWRQIVQSFSPPKPELPGSPEPEPYYGGDPDPDPDPYGWQPRPGGDPYGGKEPKGGGGYTPKGGGYQPPRPPLPPAPPKNKLTAISELTRTIQESISALRGLSGLNEREREVLLYDLQVIKGNVETLTERYAA